MSEPFLGSPGVDKFRFLFPVRNRASGSCRFPDWNDVDFKCSHPEPKEFLANLIAGVKSTLGIEATTAVKECQIAPGLGMFIEFSWRDNHLARCSAQAIVVPNGTLEELFSEPPPRAYYYRFDFSVEERGNLFDHPFPHAHTYFDGAPRFPFTPENRSFPLFQWLEFLMLNHYYPQWLKWAKFNCASSRTPGLRTADLEPEDFFTAYPKSEDWDAIPLTQRDNFVRAAKRTLREAVNSVTEDFPRIPAEYLEINYWAD